MGRGFSSWFTHETGNLKYLLPKIYIKERGKTAALQWRNLAILSCPINDDLNVTGGVMRISCNLWHDMTRKSLNFCCILSKFHHRNCY